MPADEYSLASRGALKLKGSASKSDSKQSKKLSKRRKAKKLMSQVRTGGELCKARDLELQRSAAQAQAQNSKTRAEAAFDKQREMNDAKRILKKASETHKQRVENFNRHLDQLSDHYDIPKVSWTK